MCDCCRDLLQNVKFRGIAMKFKPTEESRNELEQLKKDVAKVNESLAELITIAKKENINQPSKIPPKSKLNDLSNALSSTRLPSDFSQEVLGDETLDLFLSNIVQDVTDNEMQDLVRDVLEALESVFIKRLVPAWKDQSSMDYVSFKVELHQKYRINALKSTSWPRGIRCREFKNNCHNTWRPAYRSRINCTT